MQIDKLTIDINQYIQVDDEDKKIIYFDENSFIKDAKEYLQEDNSDCNITII